MCALFSEKDLDFDRCFGLTFEIRQESCVPRQNFEFEFPYKQYKDVILTSDNQV